MTTAERSRDDAAASRWVPELLVVHTAAPIQQPPALDGSLNDACWQGLPEGTCFYDADYGVPRKAASRTTLKVGYDTNGLYFGVRCEDDHPEAIRATATRPGDENLWKDDCLEFYFADAANPGSVRQFAFNTLGTLRQFAFNTLGTRGQHERLEGGRLVPCEPSGWQVAVANDDRGWAAELFIPFAELGAAVTGQRNDLCRFAVRRFVYSGRGLSAVTGLKRWGGCYSRNRASDRMASKYASGSDIVFPATGSFRSARSVLGSKVMRCGLYRSMPRSRNSQTSWQRRQ